MTDNSKVKKNRYRQGRRGTFRSFRSFRSRRWQRVPVRVVGRSMLRDCSPNRHNSTPSSWRWSSAAEAARPSLSPLSLFPSLSPCPSDSFVLDAELSSACMEDSSPTPWSSTPVVGERQFGCRHSVARRWTGPWALARSRNAAPPSETRLLLLLQGDDADTGTDAGAGAGNEADRRASSNIL